MEESLASLSVELGIPHSGWFFLEGDQSSALVLDCARATVTVIIRDPSGVWRAPEKPVRFDEVRREERCTMEGDQADQPLSTLLRKWDSGDCLLADAQHLVLVHRWPYRVCYEVADMTLIFVSIQLRVSTMSIDGISIVSVSAASNY